MTDFVCTTSLIHSTYYCLSCTSWFYNIYCLIWKITWENFPMWQIPHVIWSVEFHMWNITCEISHMKFHVSEISHGTTHVKFQMWTGLMWYFTCEIPQTKSHGKDHMGNFTWEISHVTFSHGKSHMGKFPMWIFTGDYFTCEISPVNFLCENACETHLFSHGKFK